MLFPMPNALMAAAASGLSIFMGPLAGWPMMVVEFAGDFL